MSETKSYASLIGKNSGNALRKEDGLRRSLVSSLIQNQYNLAEDAGGIENLTKAGPLSQDSGKGQSVFQGGVGAVREGILGDSSHAITIAGVITDPDATEIVGKYKAIIIIDSDNDAHPTDEELELIRTGADKSIFAYEDDKPLIFKWTVTRDEDNFVVAEGSHISELPLMAVFEGATPKPDLITLNIKDGRIDPWKPGSYKKVSVKKKKYKGKFKVNNKTGKITVEKGTSKGMYTVKVKVAAAGDKNHKAKSETVSVKIRIK